VILVGEIRDEETMDIAPQGRRDGPPRARHAAHAGRAAHHGPRARALGSVDPQETRERFADNLKAIIAQRLIPAAEGGLCLVAEILVVTGTARESLRKPEGNPSLKDIMERGSHPYMMQTFEMHLRELVKQGRVTVEDAPPATAAREAATGGRAHAGEATSTILPSRPPFSMRSFASRA
jgi:twitching motility protein PilT